MATLRLFAQARQAAGGRTAVPVPGATVAAVLAEATARFGPGFADVLDTAAVWLDGEPVEKDAYASTPAPERSEVAVLPPVSGG